MFDEQPPRREFPAKRRIISSEYPPDGPDLYAKKTEMFNAPPIMPPDDKNQQLPHFMSSTSPDSGEPGTRLANHKSAQVILLIAIIVVLLSGSIFAVAAFSLFRQSSPAGSPSAQNSNQANIYQTAPPQSKQVQGTVDAHPTFPVPTGTPNNTASSQPPKTGVPTYAVPTATPTMSSSNAAFKLQVVSYPQQVNNHSTVQIQVSTGQPHASVHLNAFYVLPPYVYKGKDQTTDDNGTTTINWPINLSAPVIKTSTTTARFTIQAQSTDGQVATTPGITIQVNL